MVLNKKQSRAFLKQFIFGKREPNLLAQKLLEEGRIILAEMQKRGYAIIKTKEITMTQPSPIPNATRPVWEYVIEDMTARDHVGRDRYGTPLQVNNGRDALQDAYEEALDMCVYLKQALLERNGEQQRAVLYPCTCVGVLRTRVVGRDWCSCHPKRAGQ